MSNVDTVPETDAQVDQILDAATTELATTTSEATPETTEASDTPEAPANPITLAPAPAPRRPRTGNSAQADETTRQQVKALMDELRAAGYTRPEISHYTGFNDSTVYRAQNARVHTVELDVWMPFFKLFADKQLPPPNSASRKPKPEALQAKIDDLEATHAARVQAVIDVLATEAKTVAQYRKIVEAAQLALLGDAAPVEAATPSA